MTLNIYIHKGIYYNMGISNDTIIYLTEISLFKT
jgi:hypothetical protein